MTIVELTVRFQILREDFFRTVRYSDSIEKQLKHLKLREIIDGFKAIQSELAAEIAAMRFLLEDEI